MAQIPVGGRQDAVPSCPLPFGATQRKDAWWAEWLGVIVGLGVLGVYATWAAFQNKNYQTEHYLSPFYSPVFLEIHGYFFPAAIIALVVIGGFRGTCYYYRKAYYRAFFGDPPGCAVGEGRKSYVGETKFPYTAQNFHRFFMYLSVIALVFLWDDTVHAFFYQGHLFIGLGSLVMLVNVVLLSAYTLGCHSIRHLVGGKLDCFSCAKGRASAWSAVSKLNAQHQQWAWASLVWVCATDLYIRLVASGVIVDWRLLG